MKSFRVNVVDKTTIRKGDKRGNSPVLVSKYAQVPSATQPGVYYTVNKYRRGTIVNAQGVAQKYTCTCNGFLYYLKPCKHIVEFKVNERG